MRSTVDRLAAALVLSAAVVVPAAAQGKSASAPGQNKPRATGGAAAAAAATVSPATATAPTSVPSTSPNSILYYGSWLDDASVMAPGTIWGGASSAYWRGDLASQVDAPVMMGAVGVAPRVQVGGSLPIYHFRNQDGLSAHGVGTVSAYGKLQLIDPNSTRNIGLALTPLIEVAPGSDQRFGWALPVNLEVRPGRMRVYGSAGYFSRGAVFGAGAIEVPINPRATVTGSFGQSHSGGFHQTTIGGGLSFFATPTSGVFVSIGHSSAAEQLANGGLSIGGGVSITRLPRHP